MSAACAACRFFVLKEAGHTYGDCHRNPPSLEFTANFREEDGYGQRRAFRAEISQFRNGVWPNVALDQWCGEFSPSEVG
jgi:hypothetical protein